MKKIYNEPELNVLHIGKEICTQSVIVVSNTLYDGDDVRSAGRRFDDWYEGY